MNQQQRRYYQRGIDALEQGQVDEAISLLTTALEAGDGPGEPGLRAGDLPILIALGDAHLDTDDVGAARKRFVAAVEAGHAGPSQDLQPMEWLALTEGLRDAEALDSATAQRLLAVLDRSADQNPTHAEPFVARGLAQRARGLDIAAIDEFEHAAALDDDRLDAWLGAAVGYAALGLHAEAAEMFEEAAELEPDVSDHWRRLGFHASEAGDAVTAVRAFEQAIAAGEATADVYLGRGRASMALELPDDAVSDFHQAVEIEPEHAEAWRSLGLALYDAGRDAESIEAFDRAIALEQDDVGALIGRGDAYWMSDDLERAEADYRRAAEADDSGAEAWFGLAELLLEAGKVTEANPVTENLVEAFPDRAQSYALRAQSLGSAGDWLAARELLDTALAHVDEGASDLYAARARVLLAMGLENLAWRDAAWAVEAEPKPEHLALQGELAVRHGVAEDAYQLLSDALEADPYLGEAYAWRGRAAMLLGEFDAALEDWDAAGRLLPGRDPLRPEIAQWQQQAQNRSVA